MSSSNSVKGLGVAADILAFDFSVVVQGHITNALSPNEALVGRDGNHIIAAGDCAAPKRILRFFGYAVESVQSHPFLLGRYAGGDCLLP